MSDRPIIIIAEPDPMFSSSLRVEFETLQYIALLAANGAEAERLATDTDAQVVILDGALPGTTAYDACARIRHQPGYRDTPVLLTATALTPRVTAAAAKAGVTRTLCKPYSFNDLLNTIVSCLPPGHPLMTHRPKVAGLGEVAGHYWGPPKTFEWRFGRESSLSRNKAVLPIVRGTAAVLAPKRAP
jgi:DNA-binding response OmpR family regulator